MVDCPVGLVFVHEFTLVEVVLVGGVLFFVALHVDVLDRVLHDELFEAGSGVGAVLAHVVFEALDLRPVVPLFLLVFGDLLARTLLRVEISQLGLIVLEVFFRHKQFGIVVLLIRR